MPEQLDQIDKELIGEVDGSVEAANGEVNTADHAKGTGNAATFTPVNDHDSVGDEKVEDDGEKGSTAASNVTTTPKKRGNGATADELKTPPNKKRSTNKATSAENSNDTKNEAVQESASPKKRGPSKRQVNKIEADEVNAAADVLLAAAGPITPDQKSKKQSAPTVSQGKKNGLTVQKKPRVRATALAGKVAGSIPIPRSWEEASAADRMLVAMKEDSKDWNSIREAWKVMTGQEVGASTLPNRYNRIKDNMMHLSPGDDIILLVAKQDVEKSFETEKWAMIAANMATRGTSAKYSTTFLQKQAKELEANGGLAVLKGSAANGTSANGHADAGMANDAGDGSGEDGADDEDGDEM